MSSSENTSRDNTTSSPLELSAEEGMELIAHALEDAKTRDRVDQILTAYAKLDRISMIMKKDIMTEDLTNVIGARAALALANFINSPGAFSGELVKLIKNKHQIEFVKDIAVKFNPLFAGFYTNYIHDWYRIAWKNRYDLTNSTLAIETTILKNSGETVYLDMPLVNVVTLVHHLLAQIDESLKTVREAGTSSEIATLIQLIKNNLTSITDTLNSLQNSGKAKSYV